MGPNAKANGIAVLWEMPTRIAVTDWRIIAQVVSSIIQVIEFSVA
jgi:hypothetical protein